MKNLISYPKHAVSTILVFFVFLMIAEAQDYSQVRREDGLNMQREDDVTGSTGFGMLNFYHHTLDDENPNNDFDFIFMRATADDGLNNNCILTEDGLFLVGAEDKCARTSTPDNLPPDVKLYVNGDAAVSTGNATWTILSDERLKKDVNALENSLNTLRKVDFVEFKYNGLAKTSDNKKHYGVLAQQAGKVLPSTVSTLSRQMRPSDKKKTDLLMFNPNDLIYTGLNAIKELADINEEQHEKLQHGLEKEREKNEILENRVDDLENKLEQLINLLGQNKSTTSLGSSKGKLNPNVPNPLSESTLIEYELPTNTKSAFIFIQDMHGKILKKIALSDNVESGTVEFNAIQTGLISGTYLYVLVINGQPIDSQKMIFIGK